MSGKKGKGNTGLKVGKKRKHWFKCSLVIEILKWGNNQIPNSTNLALRMISKTQRAWDQFRDVTATWIFRRETTTSGDRVNFVRPFFPNSFWPSILRRTDWGGKQTVFVPGRGKPQLPHW